MATYVPTCSSCGVIWVRGRTTCHNCGQRNYVSLETLDKLIEAGPPGPGSKPDGVQAEREAKRFDREPK